MQILVLGMHRSGTSATSGLIHKMGAYLGPEKEVMPPTDANPKGYFERQDVMWLNNELLKFHRCQWHELAQWDFARAADAPPEILVPMHRLVQELNAHRPWLLKDPRMCLLLAAWRPLLEMPVAVLVYRHPLEIARSLKKRDGLPVAYGLALWEYHAVGMLNATRQLPRQLVSYAGLLQHPVENCAAIFQQLVAQGIRGLAMPAASAINELIDPALYRVRAQAEDVMLSPAQRLLADMLQGLHPQDRNVAVSEESRAIIRRGLPS